ncbi:MAG TPA: DUF4388 domain-containing protein [Mycobacteriales bacterium]|nr:DUF4388 domain-containing protein [Mycobacteriales bacterium]
MLKGDLATTALAPVLLDLAASGATGSVILNRPDGAEAQLFLRGGLVCGFNAPDQRTDLGAKLVSSGVLAPEALSDALEAQRTDLSAWNLGELLVHLGYIDEDVIQEFVTEQLHEALWDFLQWSEGRWKFRKNAKIREDIRPPHAVVELLETLRERGYEWEEISSVVSSPDAIPVLSARGDGAPETTLDSDAWSMLCKIDGVRSVAELANDCGYTLFEAGQVLVTLVDAGLVDISDDVDDDSADVYGASALAEALSGRRNASAPADATPGGGDDALTRLARLASDVTSHGATAPATNPLQLDVMAAQLNGGPSLTVPLRRNAESFAASMGRVSGALADALGPPPEDTEGMTSLIEIRRRPRPARTAAPLDGEQELERRRRLRAAAAAELASAQADAESLRPDHDVNARSDSVDDPPKLVDLEAERARVAAREAEEAARHASEEAARRAAEEFARAAAEQAARHAAELAETQSTDQAAQAAAEQAAALAAQKAAAEKAAAEKAAAERVAAEQAAAEKAAAEQAAAEQARRDAEARAAEEAARLAEQQAAEEAARKLAEQQAAEEAARLAEQQAAEEAARKLAEQQAAAAAEQAQREAAEQAAAQAAQAAAEQAAAEQAAAEQAAKEAAERAAAESREAAARAEAEAALVAAQAQAAAAEEAQRLAAQAQRLADEQAALAAEAAAKHAAIDEQDFAAAAIQADQAAQASAMLAELHHSASDTAVEPMVAVVPDPTPASEPEPEPAPVPGGGDTDTAALLRELSSLGVEDDNRPPAAPVAPRAPRPSQADAKKAKKKIGLFGL